MPLVLAITQNNLEEVKKLINEGADVNKQDRLGFMPLCEAAYVGSAQMVSTLLEAGAKINLCDARGRSPLHVAVYPGCSLEMVQLLIKSGANVNQKISNDTNTAGETPAHLVFFSDSYSILTHLIRSGADLTIKNSRGETPLEVGKIVDPSSTCVKILEKIAEITDRVIDEDQKKQQIAVCLENIKVNPEGIKTTKTLRRQEGFWTLAGVATEENGVLLTNKIFSFEQK